LVKINLKRNDLFEDLGGGSKLVHKRVAFHN